MVDLLKKERMGQRTFFGTTPRFSESETRELARLVADGLAVELAALVREAEA